VLFVDDDPSILEVMTGWLESNGLDVTSAPDGGAAATLLEEGGRWDLLITDYMMPGMSGIALASKVRECCPDAGIILASGYTDGRVDPDQLATLGAGWLTKPYTLGVLLERSLEALHEDSPE
jgi:two-component system, cell cycle sensor histidine kinase and response regulator CckA